MSEWPVRKMDTREMEQASRRLFHAEEQGRWIPVRNLLPFIQEMVQLMVVGDVFEVYIPWALRYVAFGRNFGALKTKAVQNVVLFVYRIELVGG